MAIFGVILPAVRDLQDLTSGASFVLDILNRRHRSFWNPLGSLGVQISSSFPTQPQIILQSQQLQPRSLRTLSTVTQIHSCPHQDFNSSTFPHLPILHFHHVSPSGNRLHRTSTTSKSSTSHVNTNLIITMKVSSAITLTTVASIMSAVHGAPLPNPEPVHHRRHSSVSELSDRNYQGGDFMQSLGAAFEPGNSLGKLVNYVKRQVAGGDSSNGYSAAHGATPSTETSTTSNDGETAVNPSPHNTQTDNTSDGPSGLMGGGLMGGALSSTADAGFAFEPGQSIRTGSNANIPSVA